MIETIQEIKKYDGNSVWTTIDGLKIKVKDLETTHAINIIKFLDRKGFVSARVYKSETLAFEMSEILFGDSDAEDDAFGMSLYHGVLSKRPSRMMDAIIDELKRRNIDTENIL